mmetsp:Transcript_20225/g.48181  ORF Transcript_20225/g.48181 Transcript_20225/m.48181 type:complete len:221 (-) Transcript_20225:179-841(-)
MDSLPDGKQLFAERTPVRKTQFAPHPCTPGPQTPEIGSNSQVACATPLTQQVKFCESGLDLQRTPEHARATNSAVSGRDATSDEQRFVEGAEGFSLRTRDLSSTPVLPSRQADMNSDRSLKRRCLRKELTYSVPEHSVSTGSGTAAELRRKVSPGRKPRSLDFGSLVAEGLQDLDDCAYCQLRSASPAPFGKVVKALVHREATDSEVYGTELDAVLKSLG